MHSSLKLLGFVIKSELRKRFPKRISRPSFETITSVLCSPGMPFEIEQVEVDGRTLRCWKNAAPSMAALVESSLEYGDADFIVYGDERLSYREHHRRVVALAHQLIDRFGIAKGDRVAIAMRNYPEWSVAFWAAAAAGAVVVPLNAWWTSDELEYGLTDSGASLLFVDAERLERLQNIESDLPLQHVVAVRCDTVPADVTVIDSLWLDAPDEQGLPAVSIS
ncbi:MAG: AMP-binding protein, partial [Gammaproteobacteria bacterium]|nr:AMP-binding protein [Gammaproteobacteria bacterium]